VIAALRGVSDASVSERGSDAPAECNPLGTDEARNGGRGFFDFAFGVVATGLDGFSDAVTEVLVEEPESDGLEGFGGSRLICASLVSAYPGGDGVVFAAFMVGRFRVKWRPRWQLPPRPPAPLQMR